MPALHRRLAVALGAWTGVTAAPLASLAAVTAAETPVVPTGVVTFVALTALGTGVAWIVLQRLDDPATRLRDGPPAGLLIGIPGTELVAAVAVAPFESVSAALPFALAGLVGSCLGWGVMRLADNAVVRRKRAATEDTFAFAARKTPAPRWRQAVAVAGLAGAAVWAATVWSLTPWAAAAPLFLGLSEAWTLVEGRVPRRYELIDGGLITRLGHLPWKHFDGFELTADAVVLHGNTWPFGRVELARDSIDDVDALVDALEQHLPRTTDDAESDDSVVGGLRETFELS